MLIGDVAELDISEFMSPGATFFIIGGMIYDALRRRNYFLPETTEIGMPTQPIY